MEIAAIQNICDIYFQEEKNFKERITYLETEKDHLEQELYTLKNEILSKNKQFKEKYSNDIEYLRAMYSRLLQFVKLEISVH